MKKKKVIIIISIIIILLILLIPSFTIRGIIQNTNNDKQPEELYNFSCETKLFTLNEDYTYNFLVVVMIQEVNGIDTVKYQKNGQEIVLNGYGKQKIAIDYNANENVDYEFKITPVGGTEKTEILNVARKSSGKDTYKLVNGIYVNEPFLENFNEKYTRYMTSSLKPGNWIYDSAPSNWYDYKNRNWANIYVEAEGVEAYYVWIPRYMYKLDQDSQRSDVKFVDVFNNYKDSSGNVTTCKELVDQGYQLPEAFDWGDDDVTSLSGYWISKFQLSELSSFNLDYNMAASATGIYVSNFTNNVSSTSVKFTYAINGKIKQTTTSLSAYTFSGLTKGEDYVVNVTALDSNGYIVGSMTKVLYPTEVNPPELDGFDPETTFYVYWDSNGLEHNEIPIKNDPPADWYDYTYANWANIVTRNDGLESYYVWIPRYQYQLNQTSQRSSVKFILGTGTTTETGYKIPEAFWWDKNNNGTADDGEQLTGYWISKYQLSREESNAKISAELSPGSDHINVKNITGTSVSGVSLKFEYYLDGVLKHTGTSSTEQYQYTGLTRDTTYTVNIIARNASTNAYVGAITKKVTTKAANEPDISVFKNNSSLKTRTYYVVFNGEQVQEYVPITSSIPDNWYDYSKSRWANIVVTDGTVSGNTITGATATSYFVWIPRYQYRILQSVNDWSNLDTSNERIDVKFITGTSTVVDSGYKIPEAFWWDKNNNGSADNGEQLTGYWMSKFQLSN